MWHSSPEFEFVAQGSASIVSEKAGWLSRNILILLIPMRTQHCKKPWTRAGFYLPLIHKGTSSPLFIEMVWNRTAPHRLTYLNTHSLVRTVGIVGNWGCRKWGLAGRGGPLTMCRSLKIQSRPGSPLVSLCFQAQKVLESSPHAPAASKRQMILPESQGWSQSFLL